MTPLAWAAKTNDLCSIKTLLDLGSNPNISDNRDTAPLMMATEVGCLAALIDGGAMVDAVDNLVQTPLFYATNSTLAIKLLLDSGAFIDALESSRGMTAAHFCAENNRAVGLASLLEGGIDPGIGTMDGSTFLHTAFSSSNAAIFEVITSAVRNCSTWLDLAWIDGDGGSARLLAEARMEKCPELEVPIMNLIRAVEDQKPLNGEDQVFKAAVHLRV